MSTSTLSRLTFGGILRSEFIKLRTLRSTIWCYGILVVVTIGLGVGLAALVSGTGSLGGASQAGAVAVATLGLGFSQLVVVVLGALVITGEYGTGMIRTTLTAAPHRVVALLGKALVFAVITAVIGAISIVLSGLLSAPILSVSGSPVDFSDGKYWVAVLGAAGYLALVGLFAFTLGAIIRNSAGGIAAALGVVLVLPTILSVIGGITQNVVIANVATFLPSNAGARMYAYATDAAAPAISNGEITLEPWQGGLVLLAWVVVLGVVAAMLVKRRDV
jgi:ABC-2 type transport system permease protein